MGTWSITGVDSDVWGSVLDDDNAAHRVRPVLDVGCGSCDSPFQVWIGTLHEPEQKGRKCGVLRVDGRKDYVLGDAGAGEFAACGGRVGNSGEADGGDVVHADEECGGV